MQIFYDNWNVLVQRGMQFFAAEEKRKQVNSFKLECCKRKEKNNLDKDTEQLQTTKPSIQVLQKKEFGLLSRTDVFCRSLAHNMCNLCSGLSGRMRMFVHWQRTEWSSLSLEQQPTQTPAKTSSPGNSKLQPFQDWSVKAL